MATKRIAEARLRMKNQLTLPEPIADALDEATLRELNARVDVDGEPVEQVARDFLEQEGFLEPQQLTR